MRKIAITLALVSLAGCATVQTKACENRDTVAIGLDLAYAKALEIPDPVNREAALSAIRISRAALDKCNIGVP